MEAERLSEEAESEFRCMLHDRWLTNSRVQWSVVLLIVAAGLFLVGTNVTTRGFWITSAGVALAGIALVTLIRGLLATTQNRIRLFGEGLEFSPALSGPTRRWIPYSDVVRLIYNGVVISLISRDGEALTFQPYRLVTEDIFEHLSERVAKVNSECTIVDRS